MYAKYTTEACVMRSREQGEADKLYTLYTREFGLVYARASSVRKHSSKMRAALTLGSVVTVSLVKGKRGWRLAGALPGVPLPIGAPLEAYMRTLRLVERLVHGEDAESPLFEVLSNAYHALGEGVPSDGVELLTVSRVLYHLGYLSPGALGLVLVQGTSYTYEEVDEVLLGKHAVLMVVNSAITATQL